MDDLYDLAYLNAVENVEEAELLVNDGPRQMYMPHDPLDLSDRQFINIYRLNRNNVDNLIDILQPYITVPNRVGALTVERKVRKLRILPLYTSIIHPNSKSLISF